MCWHTAQCSRRVTCVQIAGEFKTTAVADGNITVLKFSVSKSLLEWACRTTAVEDMKARRLRSYCDQVTDNIILENYEVMHVENA